MSDIGRTTTAAALLGVVALLAAPLAARPLAAQGAAPANPYGALPAALRREVDLRGCRPPIRADADSATVVAGSLYGAADARDLAVLCVRGDSGEEARVLVFRAADGARPAAVLDFLASPSQVPSEDGGTKLCEGGIELLRATDVRALVRDGHLADADGGRLTATERGAPVHDAVLDGDCDGVSVVHYWTGRRWVLLPGAD